MFPDQNIQPEAKQKLPLCSSSWLVIPRMVCRVNCLIMYIVGTPLQFSLLITFCSGGNISDGDMWRERERNVKIRMKRHQTMMKAWLVSEPSNFIWIQLTNIEQLCPKLYIV